MFQNTVNKLVEQEGQSVGFSSWPQQFINAFRVKVDGKWNKKFQMLFSF